MNRRDVIAGALAAGLAAPARAQSQEILIGAVYPMSGANAQVGVDSRQALEAALSVINGETEIPELGPLAARLKGRKLRLIFADHQSDPQKGRAEAERLITQEKVVAVLGAYQSAVSTTVSLACERYGLPFICADSSSPSLQKRGLKFFFRAGPDDIAFTRAMFDFFDAMRKEGRAVETLALFHEDTIFGTDSAAAQTAFAKERGYKIVADIRYRANSPSLSAEVLQLKTANADVLMPTSYTTDAILLVRTMAEVGYKPKAIVAQSAGFTEKALYDAVGDKLAGCITRASFSLDLSGKRAAIPAANALFKARSGKDMNDNSSRQFMAALVLADALGRAASTEGVALRDALAATDIPGERTIMPWRRVKFDTNGQNMFDDAVLLQYGKDSFATIFPQDVASAPTRWPM